MLRRPKPRCPGTVGLAGTSPRPVQRREPRPAPTSRSRPALPTRRGDAAGDWNRCEQGRRLVAALEIFQLGIAVDDDASPGLHAGSAVRTYEHGANGDGRVE